MFDISFISIKKVFSQKISGTPPLLKIDEFYMIPMVFASHNVNILTGVKYKENGIARGGTVLKDHCV